MESVTGVLMDVSVHKAHEQAMAEQLTNALEAKRARENFIGKLLAFRLFSRQELTWKRHGVTRDT